MVSKLEFDRLKDIKAVKSQNFETYFEEEAIPLLIDVLNKLKSKTKFAIELKDNDIEKDVLDTIIKSSVIKDVIILNFDINSLIKLRALNKEIKLLQLVNKISKPLIDNLSELKINYIAVGRGGGINPDIINYAMSKSIKIWKFTVDEIKDMNKYIKLDIDGIITNYSERLVELINNKNT